MTDHDSAHSGSRWEPAAHPSAPPTTGPLPAAGPVPPGPGVPTAPAPAPAARRPRRVLLAAAAVGLLLAGGLGGFALGSAAADEPGTGVTQDAGDDGARPDFDGDRPGRPGGSGFPPGTDGTDEGTTSGTTVGDAA